MRLRKIGKDRADKDSKMKRKQDEKIYSQKTERKGYWKGRKIYSQEERERERERERIKEVVIIIHSYADIAIVGKRLQNVDLCSVHMTFE